MAYMTPQQYMDAITGGLGGRVTAYQDPREEDPRNILRFTGDWMNRMGANQGRPNLSDARAASGTYSSIPVQQTQGAGAPSRFQQGLQDAGEAVRSFGRQQGGFVEDVDPVPQENDGPQGMMSKIGGFLRRPGMSQTLATLGSGIATESDRPGGSFWTGLARGSEAAVLNEQQRQMLERTQAATQQKGPQEIAGWQQTIRRIGTQKGIEPALLEEYVAIASTEDGFNYALAQIAPEGVDPTTGTSEDRNIQSLGEARVRVRTLTEQGVPEDDPRMIDAKADLNAWQLGIGITELPEGDTKPTARLQEWNEYVALRESEDPTWVKSPEEYYAFMNQVDTPVSPAQAGMDAYIQEVYNGRSSTFNDTIPSLQNVDQTLKLVNHDRFNEVAGVWSGNPIADALLRYQGDPELLTILGTFERLGSDRALAILRNFTGAKSNFEFQVSQKMAAKNRSMDPAELRAMLELMRRAYIQEAVRWAQSMVDMGQDVQIQGDYAPVQARFMSDAQGILDQYGAEERSWRENTDPLGLGYKLPEAEVID